MERQMYACYSNIPWIDLFYTWILVSLVSDGYARKCNCLIGIKTVRVCMHEIASWFYIKLYQSHITVIVRWRRGVFVNFGLKQRKNFVQ